MTKHDAKLMDAVKHKKLAPQVAARQVHDPVLAKKLRGRAKHLKRCKRPEPPPTILASQPPPNPRSLTHAELTRRKFTPRPGSIAAVTAGCTCPVLDNEHGRGFLGKRGTYVYTVGCPIHSREIAP